MIYPSKIEHLEIDGFKYLYIQDRCNKKLPMDSAVYCFVSHDLIRHEVINVVYVGKTNKISSRLIYPHIAERRHGSYLSCYVLITDQHDRLESEFIKRYRPSQNIHYNG